MTPARNQAVDVYRGFVMLLMMAEVLHLSKVAQAFPGNTFWAVLAYHQTHVEWVGCSLHDLIQPSFSFLVGVALPYSIASRISKGDSQAKSFAHALWRAFLLIALGIFLRSTHSPQTNFTFEDTLTQIGLGYPFLFLLAWRPPRWAWIALAALLTGYWLAWVLYPVPDPWAKNNNLGHAFDVWFLNLFPRVKPFEANRGGYLTLSFIPTLGTMILGLIAGRWLREGIPYRKFLLTAGVTIAAGLLLHVTGLCPIVKRIWTPAWTLFSGGACFLLLAAFNWIIETKGYRRWAFPLLVIGMNSIAAYLIAHLFDAFIVSSLNIHLGERFFAFPGAGLEPFLRGAAVLLTFWLILFWMYRRKIFLRV
ncbi:MAG: acyltransferase family protein [Bryobacteraceae bacterium]